MTRPHPTAEEQLAFLRKLRRLLDEGTFTATYKYALLHAIADLCVTRGDGSGEAPTLTTRELADQFVRLYWRQAAPFPAAGTNRPLKQNAGRQAAVRRGDCGQTNRRSVPARRSQEARIAGRLGRRGIGPPIRHPPLEEDGRQHGGTSSAGSSVTVRTRSGSVLGIGTPPPSPTSTRTALHRRSLDARNTSP